MSLQRTTDEFARQQSQRNAIIRVLRIIVFFLLAAVTVLAALQIGSDPNDPGALQLRWAADWWFPLIIAAAIFALILAIDVATPNKKLSTITGMFFGILVGLVAAVALSVLIELVAQTYNLQDPRTQQLLTTAKVLLGIGLCYLGASIVLQTQDDFRLVIPYVEFAKQIRGVRPLVLDSSALIDGRVLRLASTDLLQAPLIVPRFVITELQALSDSADPAKRSKGRRGLDAVAKLQRARKTDVTIDETSPPVVGVDEKLVEFARALPGAIITTDAGLDRVADIHNVAVINLHDVSAALKPQVVAGQTLHVQLIKPGDQPGQGVGYLDDGTMVVAENGEAHVGSRVALTITGTLQTSAGRLLFGRVQLDDAEQPERTPPPPEMDEAEHAAPGDDEQPPLDADAPATPRQPAQAPESRHAPKRDSHAGASMRNPRRH